MSRNFAKTKRVKVHQESDFLFAQLNTSFRLCNNVLLSNDLYIKCNYFSKYCAKSFLYFIIELRSLVFIKNKIKSNWMDNKKYNTAIMFFHNI